MTNRKKKNIKVLYALIQSDLLIGYFQTTEEALERVAGFMIAAPDEPQYELAPTSLQELLETNS